MIASGQATGTMSMMIASAFMPRRGLIRLMVRERLHKLRTHRNEVLMMPRRYFLKFSDAVFYIRLVH